MAKVVKLKKKLHQWRKTRKKKKDWTKHPLYPKYDQLVFDIIHDLAGIPAERLAKESYLSGQTIRNIRKGPGKGGTRYPRGTTVQELARLAGGAVVYQTAGTNKVPVTDERKLIPFVPRRKSA